MAALSDKWTRQEAAHLLSRAGFGGSPEEIEGLYKLGRTAAVDKLIAGEEESDLFPVPPLLQPVELARHHAAVKKALAGDPARLFDAFRVERDQTNREIISLRAWWLNRMRYTTFPLREKMTLFWHGHFATSFKKAKMPYDLWQQNETFRAYALGDFRALTKAVSRDPAMMAYLDLNRSSKGKPNENFARELMELFTLGEGVLYTEKDVQEAARAFTGYRTNGADDAFRFLPTAYDDSEKHFLLRKGDFSGDDVIDIIFSHIECAHFISDKIWKYLAESSPSPAFSKKLADRLINSGYDVSALVRAILLSPEFYSPQVMGRQVKSPVQWLVQSARQLEAPLPINGQIHRALANLGQNIFDPPNVKGWAGGRSWINSSTFLLRCNIAGDLLNPSSRKFPVLEVPWDRVAPVSLRNDPSALCDALSMRLFHQPLEASDKERFVAFVKERGGATDQATVISLVHLMMSAPQYQLT